MEDANMISVELESAIDQSIHQNEIVHLDGDKYDCQELSLKCDDYVQTKDESGNTMYEFWGKQDGEDWRIHLHLTN
jgi:hypothetical protein